MLLGAVTLALPVMPGLLWLWLIYRTDRDQPEPKRLVARIFLLGALATVPAALAELLLVRLVPGARELEVAFAGGSSAGGAGVLLSCFFVIGPCEEVAKFLVVRLGVFRHREFDEPLDGLIYASAAALGFASLENVFYVIDGGGVRWGVLLARTLFSLPGHVLFSAGWGAALGRARFDPAYRVAPWVAMAALLHGLYDHLILTDRLRPLVVVFMLVVGAWVVRELRRLRAASPFRPADRERASS